MHREHAVKVLSDEDCRGTSAPISTAPERRLQAVLAAHVADDVAVIYAAAMDAVRSFGPQHDDQTLLVARVL